MNLVRKSFVHLLASLLLICVVAGAISTSLVINLSTSSHVKSWLSQSKLYDHFIANVTKQSVGSSDGDNTSSSGILPTDPVIQDAASKAFSPQLLENSVNTFLDNNYQWLQGKISQPNFVIDLTPAKQQFATLVAKAVETHLASIPACTKAEAAQASANFGPLDATCLPPGVSAKTEASTIYNKLLSSDGFLNNSIITPQSLNPNNNGASEPYYEKLASLPKYYKLAISMPLILAGVAAILSLGIVFIHPMRRRGIRRVGVVLLSAGLLTVVAKFAIDYVYPKVIDKAFNSANTGPIQVSLTDFAHRAESAIIGTTMYLGLGLVILAIIIFVALTRTGAKKPTPALQSRPRAQEPMPTPASKIEKPQVKAQVTKPVVNDFVAPPVKKAPPTLTPLTPQQRQSKKRPRLVQ